jgi:superfamily II DNA or RNA helicase
MPCSHSRWLLSCDIHLQCLQNDLKKGTCPAHQLVCLVVDECHRATGDAAMAKSLQLLRERRAHFRVLGLSATPGNSHDKIKVTFYTRWLGSADVAMLLLVAL